MSETNEPNPFGNDQDATSDVGSTVADAPPIKEPWDEDAQPPGALPPQSIRGVDPAKIPPRRFIYGRRFIRRGVTMTVAAPGFNKTTLMMHEAVAITAGVDWAGCAVHEPGPVWFINNEEDQDELYRRLFAVLDHMNVKFEDIKDRLFLNSGAEYPLLIATRDENGDVAATPAVDACVAHLKEIKAVAFFIDPLAEVHTVEENSNQEMRAVMAIVRRIAQQANVAISISHHTRKLPAGSSEGYAGSMDSARGASSLAGVIRVAHTLYGMSKGDAERLAVPEDERRFYLRLDDAKSNLSAPGGSPIWLKRESVTIANGDEIGVLAPVDLTDRETKARENTEERHRSIIARLISFIDSELTVNKAGIALIEQEGTLYPTHQNKNFNGRCPATVRKEIEAAVASGITVNGQTFQIDDREGGIGTATRTAKMLVRVFGDGADDDLGEIPF